MRFYYVFHSENLQIPLFSTFVVYQTVVLQLHIEYELDVFFALQETESVEEVAFVDVYVAQKQGDGLQRQFYLTRHQIKVVDVRRQAQTGIAAALVGRNNHAAVLYLELHQRQAWLLVGLRTRLTEKQHIVLAAFLFRFDFLHECRQFPEIGRVTVVQCISAIIPPRNTLGAIPLRGGDAGFKHLEFGAEFLAGDAVRLEDVKQVGGREMQDLIGEILDRTFLVGLQFALGHDTREGLIILVHNYAVVWW